MAAALRGVAFLAAVGAVAVVVVVVFFFGGMMVESLSLLGKCVGVVFFFSVLYLTKRYLFSYWKKGDVS
jgi:hypothetical protein